MVALKESSLPPPAPPLEAGARRRRIGADLSNMWDPESAGSTTGVAGPSGPRSGSCAGARAGCRGRWLATSRTARIGHDRFPGRELSFDPGRAGWSACTPGAGRPANGLRIGSGGSSRHGGRLPYDPGRRLRLRGLQLRVGQAAPRRRFRRGHRSRDCRPVERDSGPGRAEQLPNPGRRRHPAGIRRASTSSSASTTWSSRGRPEAMRTLFDALRPGGRLVVHVGGYECSWILLGGRSNRRRARPCPTAGSVRSPVPGGPHLSEAGWRSGLHQYTYGVLETFTTTSPTDERGRRATKAGICHGVPCAAFGLVLASKNLKCRGSWGPGICSAH